MVSAVTIQGSTNNAIILDFDKTSNFALAQQIATYLNAEIGTGGLVTKDDTGGSPPVLPPGTSGAYVQATTRLAILPSGYTADLVTKAGPVVVFGSGAADETILSGAQTSLAFLASSGSGTVVAGGGNDRLLVSGHGAENWSLYTGDGNDFIAALDGVNATIGAGGGHNAIQLGNGNDVVISTGRDSIAAGSGHATIDATGARSDFIQGGSSSLVFVGGSGGATISGGTGSDTFLGSTGAHVGDHLVRGGTQGNNFLFAGNGQATLIGGGNNDQLISYGSSDQLLVAGAGNETLSAAFSTGNDTMRAGTGNDVLIGGSGSDTFVGGSGQSTVVSGSGDNTFAFINHHGGGTQLVQGIFDPASIKINLQGYDPLAAEDALAGKTVTNGSVTIGLSDGTKITFQDVASLNRSNFN